MHFLFQGLHYLEKIVFHPVIGEPKDRCPRVVVYGNDGSAIGDSGHMLKRAADPEGKVDLGIKASPPLLPDMEELLDDF